MKIKSYICLVMTTNMKALTNHIVLIAISIIVMTAGLATSCKTQKSGTVSNPEFINHIKAYSEGIVNDGSPIQIIFGYDIYDAFQKVKSPEKLFSFSPKIKGTVTCPQTDRLEFHPDKEAMKAGSIYKATFHLDRLLEDIDPDLKDFNFHFAAAAKTANLDKGRVTVYADNPDFAEISYTLTLSHSSDCESVKSMLSMTHNGQEIDFKITKKANNEAFIIRSIPIKRENHDSSVEIKFESKDYGESIKSECIVPKTDDFRVIDIEQTIGKETFIDLTFSEPLKKSQDLEGLIEMDPEFRSFYEIENNHVRLTYDSNSTSSINLTIYPGIQSSLGKRIKSITRHSFEKEDIKPAVELLTNGSILPDDKSLTLPFRAVNLSGIDVEVIEIFENNILSFLQENDINGNDGLRRSGKLVCRKHVRLDSDPELDLHKWQTFQLELGSLFTRSKGSIYRVILSFTKEYSLYGKKDIPARLTMTQSNTLDENDLDVWSTPYPNYYRSYINWSKYNWRDIDNPETDSYYMDSDKMPECNLLASDIGIMAKSSSNGSFWVIASKITDAEPIKNAEVTLYNYQLQTICNGTTDNDGICRLQPEEKPFVVLVSKDTDKGYLKVTDGKENSTSRFDTGGTVTTKGMKGFIYGDRGVWRPGDTLHLTMIVNNPDKAIPEGHPVIMELYSPLGQFFSRQTNVKGTDGFYSFHIPIPDNAATGTWNAWFKIGGASFHKAVNIETIKPNRLKINTKFKDTILESGKSVKGSISATWLTGPAASGATATIDIILNKQKTSFAGYTGYEFDNTASHFTKYEAKQFKTILTTDGKSDFSIDMPELHHAPGMLRARIVSRVTEGGGDESITTQTMLFSPFDAYVGISLPDISGKYIETDTDNQFNVVCVDKNGKTVSGHRIEYKIYKLKWSWWWENHDVDSYVSGNHAEPLMRGEFVSSTKANKIPFRIDYPEWGRYLIYIKDCNSGHSASGIVYVDWPSWRGRSDKTDPDGLAMLSFSLDKKSYKIGETATIFIPASKTGKALVSIENSRDIIFEKWVDTNPEGTRFSFKITEDMVPNFYVHISLIQKYRNPENDLPLRMYGIQNVSVLDEDSHLYPEIEVPEVIRPQTEFVIKVKERKGRAMTYTLAIVDEGLLDLTAFPTPDPWTSMYAKEALGVRTWDIYNDVAGAFEGTFPRLLGIGGDEMTIDRSQNANRFNPVVKFIGPFHLEKGKSMSHKITLPMYVGSVRIMLVAGHDGSYGNDQKTVPVKNALMILPTMPRVLGTGETAELPVNVFALEKGVEKVNISVRSEGPVTISNASKNLVFNDIGDKMATFSLKTGKKEGTAKIDIVAESGKFKAIETIHIEVRNPSASVPMIQTAMIDGGESVDFNSLGNGNPPVLVELNSFPSFNLNGMYLFADGYSHHCTEQLSSRGITMLFLKDLLDKKQQTEIDKAIPEILHNIYSRQNADGGFALWNPGTESNAWVSSMVGELLIKAGACGYEVDHSVMNRWLGYQQRMSRTWRPGKNKASSQLDQAYRLYTMAMASNENYGAMNRLRETDCLSTVAAWKLSTIYAMTGKKDIAVEMIGNLDTKGLDDYKNDITFGSVIRDKAIVVEALVQIGEITKALALAEELGRELSEYGYTTQTTAFASIALGRLAEKLSNEAIEAVISSNGQNRTIKTAKCGITAEAIPDNGSIRVKNLAKKPVSATVTSITKPEYGSSTTKTDNGISLSVKYKTMDGVPIRDISTLRQGTEFTAEITVRSYTSTGDVDNLALTQLIPSGWEIFNERLFLGESGDSMSDCVTDIRDDRKCWYFSLGAGESKTFSTRLRAAYCGKFVLPSITCEAMYDTTIFGSTEASKTEVVK